jgi:hypothetical protein
MFEKPSLSQIEDHVGAVPEGAGHPVLAASVASVRAESPPELELPLLEEEPLLEPLLLALLEPRPKPASAPPELPRLIPKPESKPPPPFAVELLPVGPPDAGPTKPPPLRLLELEPLLDSVSVALGMAAPPSIPSRPPASSQPGGSLASTRHPTVGTQPTIAATRC